MNIDLFTENEVRKARKLLAESSTPHSDILDQIVTPEVMARIDLATNQRNDRTYMAYRLEFVATHAAPVHLGQS